MVNPPEEGILKEARDADNNNINNDCTLLSIIPPQLKKISERYKGVCDHEYYISQKNIHLPLLSWCDIYLRKLNDLSQNSQNRRSGEKSNLLFDTYKNSVIPHGRHIYAT